MPPHMHHAPAIPLVTPLPRLVPSRGSNMTHSAPGSTHSDFNHDLFLRLRFPRPPYVSLGPIIQVIFTVRGEEETQWDEESTHMQYNSQTKVHDTIREWRTHCDSRLFFECQV